MEISGFDVLTLFTWANLFAIALGTFVGLMIGALPGLGAPIAVVLLLPLTYSMEPLAAILLLLATYQAAEYGGSISSIVLGIPGVPAAAATVLDGNPLSKKSSPGKALAYSLTASTIGGLIGGLGLIFLTVPLASLALNMSDPEFFLIGILGLVAVAGLSTGDTIKSYISVILGLMAGTVGIDAFSGAARFTLGWPQLLDGIGIVSLLVGMYAFSALFEMISRELNKEYVTDRRGLRTNLSLKEFKSISKSTLIGSTIGSMVGIFPGMGAGSSSWFAYSIVKGRSKKPETFGKGNPEGIAAPESANNATVGSSLVPLLALGIPGSPTTAIIMGAFIIHGVAPGPTLFKEDLDLVHGIFFGFLLTTVSMYLLGRMITPLFSRILVVPNSILIPTVLALSLMGIYASSFLFFSLWLGLITGIICFILMKLDFSLASAILAFILSPIIEDSLRRTLMLSDGSYGIFFTRGYSLVLILIILAIVGLAIIKKWRKNRRIIN